MTGDRNVPPSKGSTDVGSNMGQVLASRAPRAALALAAGQAAVPLFQRAEALVRNHLRYTVKVLSTDDVYDDLHEWVLGLLPAGRQRALIAWTSNRNTYTAESSAPAPAGLEGPASHVRLRYDGTRDQTVTIGPHRVNVAVNEVDGGSKEWKPSEIVFTARSAAAQRYVINQMNRLVDERRRRGRRPRFRVLSNWGDWQSLDELPPRTLESVVLPPEQLERLIGDVQSFLDSEQQYARRCSPWHRGHLYSGPPGTGKTSVARAIAHHFGMDVWYLPLGDVARDADLIGTISRITPRSMLLLEDVDVFDAATKRQEGAKASLSGLLNSLDGIATPHGLFTVLTTNDASALDSALIRAGRVDLVEEFELADPARIVRIVRNWFDDPLASAGYVEATLRRSPADVIEACKRSDTAKQAIHALRGRGKWTS